MASTVLYIVYAQLKLAPFVKKQRKRTQTLIQPNVLIVIRNLFKVSANGIE